jgi:uncharacterized membrane protein YcaP (DUF421 family)
MAMRAVFYFFFLLVLIRLGGARIFGRMSSFDNVVMIVLGAIATRGIVGSSPTGSTIAACVVIVALERLCAQLAVRSRWVRRAADGRRVVLYRDGSVDRAALDRTALSEDELLATLRLETHGDRLDAVEEAALETSGRISFITRA